MKTLRTLTIAIPALLVGAAAISDSAKVRYPDNYRDWTHAKSMVITPDHPLADPFAGIHHVYANDAALSGLETGSFDAGAVLVFDLLDYDSADGGLTEGARKFVGVMEFDEVRFSRTGGWGFEAFAGDSRTARVVEDGGVSCFGCHQAMKHKGYVFTEYRP